MTGDEKTWLLAQRAQRCVDRLSKHRFDAHYLETAEEVAERVRPFLEEATTVGFGGSDTVRSLGLHTLAEEMGKELFDHHRPGLTYDETLAIRKGQQGCDLFFTSANALSETGEIVNMDGIGNRTSAMGFGPSRVVVVAGYNKVASDLHAALRRIREVAGPLRAKSLGVDTPCAITGVCSDCNAPMRICNITTILHRKPMLTEVTVLVVGESLGY
ncbi:lactate utilization protein [Desulfoluna sp.]|uniref:lactate utilization protein n=1 Tax=Desulfoluna sp. TaxID=2045199 RepID=UPI00262E8B73|nr:lactate utilization protein [Desulfoluna sp.]